MKLEFSDLLDMNSHFCVGQTLKGIGVRNIFCDRWMRCYLWLLDNCGTASLYRFCIRDKAFTIQVGVNEVGWLAVDIAFLLV